MDSHARRSDTWLLVPVALGLLSRADANENLTVTWLRNNETIDFRRQQRHLTYDPVTHRLTVQQAVVGDTANYSCRADNGLDAAESPQAKLTVKGRFILNTCVATFIVVCIWFYIRQCLFMNTYKCVKCHFFSIS